MMKPASAPPSPSSTRASTPADAEEDDSHLYDDEDDNGDSGIQFGAGTPSGAIQVSPRK